MSNFINKWANDDFLSSICEMYTDEKELIETLKSRIHKIELEMIKPAYFIVFKKENPHVDDDMPYYACRIQKNSIGSTVKKIEKRYGKVREVIVLLVPSRSFFEIIKEKKILGMVCKGNNFKIDATENELIDKLKYLYVNHIHLIKMAAQEKEKVKAAQKDY